MRDVPYSIRLHSDLSRPVMLWTVAALALLSAAPVFGLLSQLDPRLLEGASVWAKPLKFSLGFGFHFAALALITHQLSQAWQQGRRMRQISIASIVALLAEMGWITVQASRGLASHFNLDTVFFAFMYFVVMGGGALVLIAASAAVGIAAWRDRSAELGPGLRLGGAVGLIGGSALTLLTAGFLAQSFGHHVGTPPADGALMPVTGWSMAVGDLRVPHFLATHGMQALPLLGLLVDRSRAPVAAVWLGAVVWFALVIGTFLQALAGQPLLSVFAG